MHTNFSWCEQNIFRSQFFNGKQYLKNLLLPLKVSITSQEKQLHNRYCLHSHSFLCDPHGNLMHCLKKMIPIHMRLYGTLMVPGLLSAYYFFIEEISVFYTRIHKVLSNAKSFNEDIVPEQSALERSNHKFIRTGTAARK